MSTLLYNPDKKNKQQFIEEFVVRTAVFDELFKDIQSGKMKHPEQHYLIVGQRGTGKTTLLNRLKYAIEDDQTLKKWLIPVLFNEEQYHIIELANVWENVAGYLEDFHGFKGITEEIEKYVSRKDFEQQAFDILVKHLSKHGKKIVLFIDNIGDLLKKFDLLEVRRLREILQTSPYIRLIAGSPVVLESILDYQQPLFEFFKVIQLKGLTSEETILLLKKLAEINHETKRIDSIIRKNPARIETLRTLSGGVPRTVVLLFMVFIDDEHGNAVSDLEKVLDLVTPLYKHRMDDLPTQQQKIVDAVAKNWDAVSVKELSETLRMESKVISAQLRQLEKSQVIEKRPTNTKNHIYLLRERFFNIWYLMRYGRKQDRQRVIWLVKFLELWCDEKEIEKRILNYVNKSKKGLIDKNTHELFAEVYSFFEKIKPETKMVLKEAVPEYVAKQIQLTDKEFNRLIDKYYEDKNWNSFINLINGKQNLQSNHKTKIFKLLDSKQEAGLLDLISQKYSEHIQNMTLKGLYSMPVFYPLFFFHTGIKMISFRSTKNELEILEQSISGSFKLLLTDIELSEFELTDLVDYIGFLLSMRRYEVAMSFFNTNFTTDVKNEILKILLVTTEYLKNEKNEEIFKKYGSEIKTIVLSLSKTIEKNQKRVDELLKIN